MGMIHTRLADSFIVSRSPDPFQLFYIAQWPGIEAGVEGWLRQDLISHLPLPAFLLLFFRIHQPSLQEVLGEKGPKHHHKKRNQSHSKLRYLPAVQVLCI